MISLNTLQEYIQLIPANNQLFISEAGPSSGFKLDFIRTLMNNSYSVSSILNKNRIIIVPNTAGYDNSTCDAHKSPINYHITSLDSNYNIFNLFEYNNGIANETAYALRSKTQKCDIGYFDIFFEKQFLSLYQEIFGEEPVKTRGVGLADDQQNMKMLKGKKYALVVGTDNYLATKDWRKLNNPFLDASEVGEELKEAYDYKVKKLKDPPMDSIYKSISEFYETLKPEDQLIIYFAGHGYYDAGLMDDEFIVCSDSKPLDSDPIRNSYIQSTKLKKMINKIPASHILLVLDICHGGLFDEDVLGNKSRGNSNSYSFNQNVQQYLNEQEKFKIRRMLSSVGKESAFDGQEGRHSPFANLLLQILREKGNGKNGIITLNDIVAVLETQNLNETVELKISPHVAHFGNDDVLGEFVLVPND